MLRNGEDYTIEYVTSEEVGTVEEIKVVSAPEVYAAAELPTIRIEAGALADAADLTVATMMAAQDPVFSRGGVLVRPVTEVVEASKSRRTVTARLKDLCPDSLSYRLSRLAKYLQMDGRTGEWRPIDPPQKLTKMVIAQAGDWKIPSIAGVVTVPTMRPDGSLLTTPGYDAATRLFLVPDPALVLPPIPDRPTRAEALLALDLLKDLFAEFPFEKPVDLAVALSGLLSAVARAGMSTAPLHAIRANTPGTGKSFLVDIVAAVVMGRPCPVISAGKTEEETEKRLGSQIMAAVPMVSIDNVETEIGGVFLCQATERPMLGIRPLGISQIRETENRVIIFVTGNNYELLGDMTRRAIMCQLDAGMERPETRTFERKPVDIVLANRGAYVAAALTVLRAYRVSGERVEVSSLGSYEDWSYTVREPLVWLGEPDPVATMEHAREGDPEQAAVRELFAQWEEVLGLQTGFTAATVGQQACAMAPRGPLEDGGFMYPEFRDLLLRQAGEGQRVSTRRLGKWLGKIRGRVFMGRRLVVQIDPSNGNRYSLQPADRRD